MGQAKVGLAYGCIALSLSGWGASAFAQSNVTLYGVLDTGVEYINHANASGGSVVRMPSNTGEFPSRWGMKGEEGLGGGYKAVFQVESGFTDGTGALGQGGRLFGRQAYVGIDGAPGAITFGRQYSMLYRAIFNADTLGPGIYGLASLDTWIGAPRSDNTVAWLRQFGPLTLGASYSFGRDASPVGGSNTPGSGTCAGGSAGNNEACREWSAMASYDGALGGFAAGYDRQNGGEGAAANFFNGAMPVALSGSGNRDSRVSVDGYMNLGPVKVSAIWLNRHVESATPAVSTITSNQYVVEVGYRVNPALYIDGLVQRAINKQQDTRASMEVLRATYALSKQTFVYLQAALLQNSAEAAYSASGGGASTPGKGMNQFASMVGVRHMF
ncbi:porin [Paraburkholderia sp. J63]|uniref:porin n=1 Tax=Paraburkholderia sp. J63 TaxID=2805434 RepID=UPI002ABE779F|nr:porin [Paraburkholderia sp. J63]